MDLDKFLSSLKENVDLLRNQNRSSEAIFCLEKISLDSLNLLANHYFLLKEYEKAKFYFELLLELNFISFDLYSNLFTTYKFLEDYEKCYEIASRSLILEGNDFKKFYNMAIACRATNRFSQAIDMFSKAIEAGPKCIDPLLEMTTCRMCMGEVSQDLWDNLDKLWEVSQFRILKEKFHMPEWNGCDIQNKTLLIHSLSCGLGDFILYARFLPLLEKHKCKVVFEVQEQLSPVLEQRYSLSQINTRFSDVENLFKKPPNAYFFISIEKIPKILKIDSFGKMPTDPYVFPRNKKINFGLNEKKIKVGICSCGGSLVSHDWKRSIEFKKLLPLFDVPNVEFVNLSSHTYQFRQVNNKTIDYFAGRENSSLKYFKIEDFGDLIDIMENLDLVITVDTSICHLAGAMGKNTWVLLGKDATFFPYTYNKEYSDWYPSVKMFRKKDTWESLVDQVKQELKVFKNEKNQ
jgi:tetratricopeptide (TPR) repeat protein